MARIGWAARPVEGADRHVRRGTLSDVPDGTAGWAFGVLSPAGVQGPDAAAFRGTCWRCGPVRFLFEPSATNRAVAATGLRFSPTEGVPFHSVDFVSTLVGVQVAEGRAGSTAIVAVLLLVTPGWVSSFQTSGARFADVGQDLRREILAEVFIDD